MPVLLPSATCIDNERAGSLYPVPRFDFSKGNPFASNAEASTLTACALPVVQAPSKVEIVKVRMGRDSVTNSPIPHLVFGTTKPRIPSTLSGQSGTLTASGSPEGSEPPQWHPGADEYINDSGDFSSWANETLATDPSQLTQDPWHSSEKHREGIHEGLILPFNSPGTGPPMPLYGFPVWPSTIKARVKDLVFFSNSSHVRLGVHLD